MPKKSTSKVTYENNPFFVASNGITLLFNSARGMAVLLLVLSLINFFTNPRSSDDKPDKLWNDVVHTVTPWTVGDWALALGSGLVIGLAFIMVSSLIAGAAAHTSYKLSRGEEVKLSNAFRVAFDNLWGFIWLQLIIFVKIVLWSLLLIVPGIVMAFRYSLAGTAFFDERKNFRGNDAVKESLRLTKGAWFTTFASNMLLNLLSFGVISNVVSTGVNAVLYRQFGDLGDKKKPDAHWLSWLTLVLPFILLIFFIVLVISIVVGIAIGFSFSK
ncbi:hypothetical protein KDA14_06135 [Candidatus Saccharibacteria bacterium]|nr:hypothetical protein [Candidatus Saccharibacteria bacterium]